MVIIPLILSILEPPLHHCIEEMCGSIISKNERFLQTLSPPFQPYKNNVLYTHLNSEVHLLHPVAIGDTIITTVSLFKL